MSVYSVSAIAAAIVSGFFLPATAEDSDPVSRGAYLVNGPAACSNCHGTRNEKFEIVEGMEYAGGFHIVDPAFDVYAANITPDTETGIGGWSDEEIVKAIREGVSPDGDIVFPPMPVPTYNNMSDADVTAIVAYLRTIPAVKHAVEESHWNIPQQAMPPAAGTPAPPASDQIAYGGYIVNAVAHCFECHTPMGPAGPDLSKLGAGGMQITLAPGMEIVTSNITPDPETGIGNWTDEQIAEAITGGVKADGGLISPPMPYPWFANMTQEDLNAVIAYLRTIPPVSNKVARTEFQQKNFP